MNFRTWLVPIIAAFCAVPATAQEKLSFQEFDSLSYKAYLDSDWKKSITLARKGFRMGYDYYYLRMRAGIAAFNRNQASGAIIHFRKALKFNQDDPIALEYLYSSLRLAGDFPESRLLASNHSPAFRKKLGVPAKRLITSAYLEPGYMLLPRSSELLDFRPDADMSDHYQVTDYWFLSAGLNFEIGSRFTGSAGTSMISYSAFQQFVFRNQPVLQYEVPFEQWSGYLSGNWYLGKGFAVGLAGQYQSYNLPLYRWVENNSGGSYAYTVTSYKDLALNATLVKRFPFVTADLSGDFNRIRNSWFWQAGGGITVYPAGNVNTYLRAGTQWVADTAGGAGRFITRLTAGRKLFRYLWLEGDWYIGEIYNYSDRNAYVLFNNYDHINKRLGASLLAFGIMPHLDMAFRYQYSRRTSTWLTSSWSGGSDVISKPYPVHSFILGLTWRF